MEKVFFFYTSISYSKSLIIFTPRMYKSPIYFHVKEYCEQYLTEHLPADMSYHNVQHTKDVVSAAEEIGLGEDLSNEDLEILLIAAWFHDMGYCIKYLGHEDESIRMAKDFLQKLDYPTESIEKVCACIHATRYKHEPLNALEACMIDADRLSMGKINFTALGEKLKHEWEIYLNKEHNEKDWLQLQENYLNETSFFTNYADKNYTILKEKNIAKIRKLKLMAEKKVGFTKRLSKKTFKRSKKIATYFWQSGSLGMLISFSLNISFWNIDKDFIALGILSGLFIGILLRFYEKQYNKVDDGSTFAVSMLTRTFAMGGLFLLSIIVSTGLYTIFLTKDQFAKVYDEKIEFIFSTPENIIRFTILTILISFTINFIRLTMRILGPRTLINYLKGRYHKPRSEERIFMFIDLNRSTHFAETLDPMKYHQLLANFFNDISPAITRTKGEIYQYVGDEMVITWTIKDGIKKNNCVRCFFEMQEIIENLQDEYLKNFNLIPEFKAGLHGGEVITAIIGKLKSDIVFHGDVLNTSERILNQCHPLQKKILVSEFVVRRLNLYPYFEAEFVNSIRLKGKEKDMSLYTIVETDLF